MIPAIREAEIAPELLADALRATRIPGLETLAFGAKAWGVARGTALVGAGDLRGERLIVLYAGALRLELQDEDGAGVTLAWIPPSGIFDDTTIVGAQRAYVGSLVATQDSVVLVLPAQLVESLLRTSASAALAWASYTLATLDQATALVEDLAFRPIEERIARELRRLALTAGRLLDAGEIEIDRPTDVELAMAVGARRETVCRARAAMAKRGMFRAVTLRTLVLAPALLEAAH